MRNTISFCEKCQTQMKWINSQKVKSNFTRLAFGPGFWWLDYYRCPKCGTSHREMSGDKVRGND